MNLPGMQPYYPHNNVQHHRNGEEDFSGLFGISLISGGAWRVHKDVLSPASGKA